MKGYFYLLLVQACLLSLVLSVPNPGKNAGKNTIEPIWNIGNSYYNEEVDSELPLLDVASSVGDGESSTSGRIKTKGKGVKTTTTREPTVEKPAPSEGVPVKSIAEARKNRSIWNTAASQLRASRMRDESSANQAVRGRGKEAEAKSNGYWL